MTGVCDGVSVVGPVFGSTFPVFMRNRAREAAGTDGRLAPKKKQNRAPISGGREKLTQFVQISAAVQLHVRRVFCSQPAYTCSVRNSCL